MKMYMCLVEKSYVKEPLIQTWDIAPGTDCKMKPVVPASVASFAGANFYCLLKYLLRTSFGEVRARCKGNWGLAKTYVAAL
jgi:hypothetical protein